MSRNLPGLSEGHVIGWRCWQVTGNELRSVIYEHLSWPPGHPVVARDVEWTRTFPTEPTGIYALKFKTDVLGFYDYWHVGRRWPMIWGRVALWGLVVECVRGYRAEYAYPVSFENGCSQEDLVRMRRIYL